MDLDAARAAVDDYSCDQSIFDELQRMCLEYGDQKHLKKGESLTQGIAWRFNTVVPATWQARPQAQTKNTVVDNVAMPRPSLHSMRNKSGLTVRTAPEPATELIPRELFDFFEMDDRKITAYSGLMSVEE